MSIIEMVERSASPEELAARNRVSEIALSWERTPYVHEGRIKGKCADCTFIAKVFEEAGMMPAIDIPHYSPQAPLNRGASAYLILVERHSKREIKEEDAQVGDVAMFRLGRTFSHGGIIIAPGWPHIVHAHLTAGAVIRGLGNAAELATERRFFSWW